MTWNSTLKLSFFCLALAASIAAAQATANYVYHEQTGNDVTAGNPNTCGGAQAYVPIASPNSAQPYFFHFKVEYQFYTDTLKVYYTTDGSAPSGALGVGSGTTLVVNGNYQCTFTSGPNTIDVCNATIPAQPPGTTVKYIISARHSSGGPEIFANSGEFISPFTTSAQATLFQYTVSSAQEPVVVVESRTSGGATTANPPYGEGGTLANWQISSGKSTVQAGLTGSGSRFAGAGTPFFTVTPTLTTGVTYIVQTTLTGANASTDITVGLTTSGTSASTLPTTTTAFRSGSANLWTTLGTITPSSSTPTVTFTYSSGTLVTASARFYADAVRFIPVTPTATKTWNGGGANDFWTSGLNWGGAAPNPTGGDAIAFAGSTRLTPAMDGPFSLTSLTFNSGASAFTIGPTTIGASGGNLVLSTSGGVTNNSVNAMTLNVPIGQGAARLVMNASAGNMTFGGIIAGSGGYTKLGPGTVIWNNGGNTITGPVSISNGVFEITTSARIGGTGAGAGDVTINGGTFRNDDTGAGNGLLTTNRGIIVGPAGGAINLPSGVVQVFPGVISGAGNTLTANGPGELRITTNSFMATGGHNTFGKLVVDGAMYTLGTSSTGGVDDSLGAVPSLTTDDAITLQNGGRLRGNVYSMALDSKRGITLGTGGGIIRNVTSGQVLTIPGAIKGANTLTIGGGSPADAGTILISNPANSFGNVSLATGILRLGASGVVPDTSLVSLVAGATFDVNGQSETVRSISGAGGTISLGSGTLTLDNPTGETFGTSGSGGAISGAGGKMVKNGSGTITLAQNASTFDGGFTLNSGKVGILVNPAFGVGKLTINNSPTIAAGSGTGRGPSNPVDLNGDITFDDTFLAVPGTITWGVTGTWTLVGGNRTITVNTVAGGYRVTINGIVAHDVPGRGLIKQGNGFLRFGALNTYSGDTTILAGNVEINGTSTVGDGTGTIHLSGGSLTTTANRTPSTDPVPNPIDLTADSAITTTSPASTVDLNISSSSIGGSAGTLTFRNDGTAGAGVFQPRFSSSFTFNRPIVITNGAIGTTLLQSYNTTGSDQVFNGVISGNGSYKRTASTIGTGGRAIFTAANTYSGGTTVDRGTLLVNNTSGSGTGPGPVAVSSEGTLGGTGTIDGTVTVTGTLAPGASIGTLTLNSPPVLNGTLAMEINKATGPVLAADKLVLTSGTLTFAGALTVTATGDPLAPGDSFDLFDAPAFAGSFAPLTLPPLPTGLTWDTSQLGISGIITVVCNGTLAASAGSDRTNCAGTTTIIGGSPTATGGSGIYTYVWTPASGLDSASIANPTASLLTNITYTLFVSDSAGCTTAVSQVAITVNPQPTITVGPNPSVCAGITNVELTYSATSESPDQYNIDFDTNAETNGFVDVVFAPLTNSPIVISLPTAAPAGVYQAILTVRNSTTGCSSTNIPIALTNLAPFLSCPGNRTISTSPGLCVATNVSIGEPLLGACLPTVLSNDAPAIFPHGTTTVTWSAVASNGITSTCTELVTVIDDEPPFINCGNNETVSCNQGWGFTVPIVTDNCDSGLVPVIFSTTTNFTCGYTFEATRIWQVTDLSTNVTWCTQVVTLVDFIPPTITQCASNLTVNSLADVPAPDISLITADNQFDPCDTSIPLITWVGDVTNGSNPTIISRTYRAADACGNSVQCVQSITVSPQPTITLGANPSVCAGITNAELTYSATSESPDQYSIDFDTNAETNGFVDVVLAPLTASPIVISLPTAAPAGVYQAILTVRNSTTGGSSTNIPIALTNIAPLITCPGNRTVSTSPGLCVATNVSIGEPFLGGCLPTVLSNDAPAIFPHGTTTVTWSAVASNGITSTCTELVTVIDDEPPFINCGNNETVSCNQGWGFTVPIVTDNCDSGLVPVAISTTTNFTCGYTFEATRIWQVTDLSSNVTWCTQVVTLVDFIPPTITQCASNLTVNCLADVPAPDISLITADNQFDPCDTSIPLITWVGDITNGSDPTIISRTYRASDACSNYVQCVQTITIPASFLSLACSTNKTVECGSGWTFDEPVASGICCGTNIAVSILDTTTNGTCPQLITRTWQAVCLTNSTTCSQMVTVVDTAAPSIACAGNKTVECASAWNFDAPTASDACSGTNVVVTVLGTETNGTCPQILTRTWLATDPCGNTNTCSQAVTVVDTTAPSLTCATNKTVLIGSVWSFDPPSASDTCSGTNVVVNVLGTETNGTACSQLLTRTWLATDACGNTNSCSQTVTVVPEPLVLTCATNKTIPCGSCSLAAGPLDFSLIHTLAGDSSEGQYPSASLIQDTNGMLYGTTSAWAAGGLGTVFRVNPDGTGFTILHSLSGSGLEGATPVSSLLLASDGMLYGTASAGGSNAVGTIFKLATDGTGFTVLHHFGAGATDGRKPLAGLLEGSDTTLYGTTESGGTSNLGTVFILSRDGSGYSIIHHFGTSAGDGQNPYAALVEVSANTYFGTTSAGGVSNAGTVFTLHGNGSGYSVVYSFAGGVGGSFPCAPLLEGSDGALYGAAYSGGASNGGLIFKLNTNGTSFVILHDFLASATDGLSPFAGLIESADGDLFGATAGGGAHSLGTAYTLGKTGLGYHVLHDFASPDGIMPVGGLLLASDGALYGPATYAGAGSGTVYKLACAGGLSFNPPTASGGSSNVVITIVGTVTNGDCPKMITRTWQATDSCSSTATCSQTITIIDTIPPVITCPSNIVIFTCTNLIVPFTVGVTDNCTTNINLVCTPPSGTLFNPGTTNTIHCVATDACGNTNSCDFTIALPRPALGNLQIGLNGTTVTISWSSPGILQQSDTLFGPWTDVAGTPASPYSFTVSPSNPMRFYRLRCN